MTETKLPASYPFTLAELRAATKHLPRKAATQLVRALLEGARSDEQEHAKHVERYRAAGQEPPTLQFQLPPDQLLAYLTLVSPSAAARVDAILQQRWARTREHEIEFERRRAAERAGLIPSMDDLLDDAERRGDFSWDDPRVFTGLAVSGNSWFPEPPPATPEMIAVAEAHVAEDIADWNQLLSAAREGRPLPPGPYAVAEGDEVMAAELLSDPDPNWAFIDDYIARKDRKNHGERRLFTSIARDGGRFDGELIRALRVDPKRAVPRVVMYHLLRGYNGLVQLTDPVGEALRAALGAEGPRVSLLSTGEVYHAADLLEWFEMNRNRYELVPLFDEWRARKRTRRDIAWMRLVRDEWDELFETE